MFSYNFQYDNAAIDINNCISATTFETGYIRYICTHTALRVPIIHVRLVVIRLGYSPVVSVYDNTKQYESSETFDDGNCS